MTRASTQPDRARQAPARQAPTPNPAAPSSAAPPDPARLERARAVASAIARNLSSALSCDPAAIDLAVTTLVAGGHLLIEDVPGIGKTTLARALAASVRGRINRVQFTSDMLPSDLTGVSVFDQQKGAFTFVPGPLFANIVLADEVNRANPKAQAAMLEAMEERRVSADGNTYKLPVPFTVIATQNPVELEGTFPLPEAQLDRFMCRIALGYPSAEAEERMLMAPSGFDPVSRLAPVCSTSELAEVMGVAARVHVSPVLARYAVALLAATRTDPEIRLGASPRAGLALLAMARAHALMAGRRAVYPVDVQAVAVPVLAHRLICAGDPYGGDASARQREIAERVLASVPAPRGA